MMDNQTEKHLNEQNQLILADNFTKLMDLQSKEVELKIQENQTKLAEISIREKEIESNKEIARLSINAQLEDSKAKANFFNRLETKKLILGVVVVIAITSVSVVSMYTGNSDFVIELGKLGVAAFLGYFAGVGRRQKRQDNSDKTDDD